MQYQGSDIFYNMTTLGADPCGIKVLQNPTKNLQAFFFPREVLGDFLTTRDSSKAGVYLLSGSELNDSTPHLYIGQSGTSVGSRLSQHDQKKSFWSMALVFVQKPGLLDLNAVHAKIIESKLIDIALQSHSCVLENSTGSNAYDAQPWDKQAALLWADEIVSVTQMLGLPMFTKPSSTKPSHHHDVNGIGKEERASETGHNPRPSSYTVGRTHINFESWKKILVDQCLAIVDIHGPEPFLDAVNSTAVAGIKAKNKVASRDPGEIHNAKTELRDGLWLCTNHNSLRIRQLCEGLSDIFPDCSVTLNYEHSEE